MNGFDRNNKELAEWVSRSQVFDLSEVQRGSFGAFWYTCDELNCQHRNEIVPYTISNSFTNNQ